MLNKDSAQQFRACREVEEPRARVCDAGHSLHLLNGAHVWTAVDQYKLVMKALEWNGLRS